MRWLGALALSLGLVSAPRVSVAVVLTPPTCTFPTPSFGVQLDEEAIAAGQLETVYVDGVVAVPVRLGLGVSNIQSPAALVDSGLVNLDVLTEDGALLAGSLELALAQTGETEPEGQPAWLVWVGNEPFEADTRYQFQFSFSNETLNECPEAISSSGTRVFKTGTRRAAEDLAAPAIVSALLQPAYEAALGCCAIPETEVCLTQKRCVACWQAFFHTSSGLLVAQSPLPLSYFRLDLRLLAGTLAQPASDQGPGYTSFTIEDVAEEYCFEASLRPRATGNDAVEAVTQCLARDGYPRGELPPGIVEMPASSCADGPLFERKDEGLITLSAFGDTEQDAQGVLSPTTPRPGDATTQANRSQSSCAVAYTASSARWWLAGLALVGLGRSRRRPAIP